MAKRRIEVHDTLGKEVEHEESANNPGLECDFLSKSVVVPNAACITSSKVLSVVMSASSEGLSVDRALPVCRVQ